MSSLKIPTVFFVIGPAGSGKSSVSASLATAYTAAYLDKDVVCGRLTEALLERAGTDPTSRDDNPVYQEHVMDIEYQTLMALAGDNLRLRNSVVLDAPFGRYLPDSSFLERNAAAHEWPNARWVVIHVAVDGESIRTRIAARGLSRDRWKLENWEEFWSQASSIECRWNGAQLIHVDNRNQGFDRGTVIAEIRQQLT